MEDEESDDEENSSARNGRGKISSSSPSFSLSFSQVSNFIPMNMHHAMKKIV